MQTLVLNAAYMPIDMYGWQHAIKKVVNDKAEIIEHYVDSKLGTWDDALNAPAIIRLLYFVQPPRRIQMYKTATRKNIMERDGSRCQYCNDPVTKKSVEFEHIIPKSQGGKRTWQNIVCSCHKCNNKKRDRTPEQAGMALLKKPIAPKLDMPREKQVRLSVTRKLSALKNIPHDKWMQYIYWNVELEMDQ